MTPMRILFLGNNWVGWQVARWLKEQGEEIVGLILPPLPNRKYGEEIISTAGLNPANLFEGSQLDSPGTMDAIRYLRAEIALSVLFDEILQLDFIGLFPRGVINLHPAYLPYNRGLYPNVWSIVEGTPGGVTLHYVDSGVDTGGIISQQQVPVEPVDTGETLYRKLERACVDLLIATWPLIRSGRARCRPQQEEGTYHRRRDVERIDEIDPNQTYTARELIDIIRARTFPPYPGAYLKQDGGRIYLRLQLLREKEL